jgi:hypothetical protein
MPTNALDEIGTTARAEVHAVAHEVGGKLLLPKTPRAGETFGDRVTEAVSEEERTLFGTQTARAATVEVDDDVVARQDNGVAMSDPFETARTGHIHAALVHSIFGQAVKGPRDAALVENVLDRCV